MRQVFIGILIIYCFIIFVPPVHAIVILPAVLLIPIIKIVAIVIGSLSVPAVSISALWSKLFGKPLHITIAWAIVILVIFGIVLGAWLKVRLPERPLY
jgi:uncharacterized membrane protein YfcA